MTPREKMQQALDLLQDLKQSGYWPFASPAPCSTECRIKDGINKAISGIEYALAWHDEMFTRKERDDMNPPSMTIVQAR